MTQIGPKLSNGEEEQCLVSYRANEEPISFLVVETEIQISRILESWRQPDCLYFKV